MLNEIVPVAVKVPLPKQGRGGDVRNAPYPPVPAVAHLANARPVVGSAD